MPLGPYEVGSICIVVPHAPPQINQNPARYPIGLAQGNMLAIHDISHAMRYLKGSSFFGLTTYCM